MRPELVRQRLIPPALALLFRYACFAAMVWLTLLAEGRPAPSLPDALLARIPYIPLVDRYNYAVWLIAESPAVILWWLSSARVTRYFVTSGLLSLIRGACILVTGLGPVSGFDPNAGMSPELRWQGFLAIVTGQGVFTNNSPALYLTKDLFFSGHTATTFLLLLYVWPYRRLRWVTLALHVGVVISVFLAHLHYTIDVIGAWAITFTLFALREADVRALVASPSSTG